MAIPYCRIADCVDIIPSLAGTNEVSERFEAMAMESILDASRLIENDLMVGVDYFAPATDTFTVKQFYHAGTRKIKINPNTAIEWIKDKDGNIVDSDSYHIHSPFCNIVNDDFNPSAYYLNWIWGRCQNSYWTWLSPLSINAKWGWTCIPPNISVAVKNMACLMILNNPQANNGNDLGLSDNQEQRLRLNYSHVIDHWENKLHHLINLGIG